MNTREQILNILANEPEPIRKDTLANKLGVAFTSLNKPLAELNSAFLIHQSKGYYRITPDGRTALEQDPGLATFFYSSAAAIQLKFKNSDFDNGMAQAIANQLQGSNLDWARLRRVLFPFIVMYAIAVGKEIPSYPKRLNEGLTDLDASISKAINTFMKEVM